MSRSYHTDKETVTTKRNIKKMACGCCADMPRIIQRKPCPGDVHPVDKETLHGTLRTIPEEHVCGLERVERKPREAPRSEEGCTLIGTPFGYYSRTMIEPPEPTWI